MDTARWRRAARIAAAIAVSLPALWQLSLQARLYMARVGYPADIEWLEGAALYQAYRVMIGQSTYAPPQNGYLPLFHPPVYPTFLGLVGRVIGLDFAMARTISLLFFLGASALVARSLMRQERDRLDGGTTALLAIGCAAAGVPFFEGFYDMVREDIMAVFLVTLGAYLVEPRALSLGGPGELAEIPAPAAMRPRRILLVALVLTAAFYARLPVVFFLVWIVLFVFGRHRRSGVLLALTLASTCGITLVALQYVSRGWFWMYTVALLQDHKIVASRFGFGMSLITQFAPYIVLIPIAAIALGLKRRLSARAVLWLGMFGAALPAALLPFSKVGGFSNDFMPAAFFAGPAALAVAADGFRALRKWPPFAIATRYVVYAGLAAYLVYRHYDINRFIPSPDAWSRAKAMNAKVASLSGGVIAPRHPFVAIHNGHRSTPQFADMPYLDMLWSGQKNLNLGGYLDKARARWALVTGTEIPYSAAEVASRYQLEGPIEAPQMVIGERSQLHYLMRLNDDERDGHVLFDFEDPTLPGWTRTGEAFSITSTSALPRGQMGVSGVIGQRLANSFHPLLRDAAVGSLISPPFTIDRPRISLRVGGTRPRARVELRVGGRTVKRANGIFEGTETLTRIVWDVSSFQGKEAQLALIDDDPGSWGHVLCDQVVLY